MLRFKHKLRNMFTLRNHHKYKERNFNITELDGISKKQIDDHLLLYSGYVNHVNLILEQVKELVEMDFNEGYLVNELQRRFSFEFNGMKLHEYYFEQLETGKTELDKKGKLMNFIKEECGNFGGLLTKIKKAGLTRGIGWIVFYYNPENNKPVVSWVDSHHIGHTAGLPVLFVLDMWEHAYMIDYTSSEKKKYIDAVFKNMNWKVVEERFERMSR